MTQAYSAADYERMRVAALILVAQDAAAETDGPPYQIDVAKRLLLAETIVVDATRHGERPEELEREADKIAIEEAGAFKRAMREGRAVRWQDPGYLDWCEKRKLPESD